jgi:hypothetical protein
MSLRSVAIAIVAGFVASACQAAPADYAALARLPDWSGVWVPDLQDQDAQVASNPTPWNARAQKTVGHLEAEEQAGRPKGLFVNCLPEGMPSWMLISHNAMEILVTPGRVTMLGESDGNRLRRIYTDGRSHPDDPDLTFFGDSTGHWEGDALVVDTIGVVPQAYLAVSEAVGVPNDGDMHVVERIHLSGPDTLADDLEITAPHVLSGPWKTTRLFHRAKGPGADIEEGVCLQGGFSQGKDENGDDAFIPLPHDTGIPVAPSQ